MATTTENLGLTLPAGTDRALVSDLNGNFQTIDAFAGQATADIQEAQETANAAAPQSTTYTKTEVDTALAAKLNISDVDSTLSSTSTNPVQNKFVQAPIARMIDAGAKNLLKNEKYSGATIETQGATWTFSDGTMEARISGTVGNPWSDTYILNSPLDLSDKEYVVVVQSDTQNAFVYFGGNILSGDNIPANGQYYPGVYRFKGIIPVNSRFTAKSGTFDNNFLRVMICTVEDYSISPEFVPYTPTMRELYEMILALQNGG